MVTENRATYFGKFNCHMSTFSLPVSFEIYSCLHARDKFASGVPYNPENEATDYH